MILSRTSLATILMAALLALATALPSGAAAGVSISSATRSGGTVTVAGQAAFVPNTGAFDIGGTRTGFANDGAADAMGTNLTKGQVEVLPNGVRFIWHLNALEAVLPELVRYTWSFSAGGQTFQLQAKSSNIGSITTTEDPVGHAQQEASGQPWFQLRGACETAYQGLPTAGCYHLAFLQGKVDADANTIEITMPFNTTDRIGRVVAQGFQRGAEISAIETAGASLTAANQAVVSTTATGSFINGWPSFFAGEVVQGFVGTAAQTAPSFGQSWQTLTLNSDGSFSGTLSGASAANSFVHVRACNLNVCTTAKSAT